MNKHPKFSVIIPMYNEEESITPLINRLLPALESMGSHEIIFVNDGSGDRTGESLDKAQKLYPKIIQVIHLRTNCGKALALQTGFDYATGDIIVMMDGDLQDQPEEIHKLTEKIEEGYDAVTGWKVDRKDSISKTLPSIYFNRIMQRLSGLEINDFNCGLKAFKRECLDSFTLYGQMHRLILVFIDHFGFRVGQVEVKHAPRLYGVSKYGAKRIYHGLMDILTVFFITRYLESPLYFFGIYGLCAIGVSIPFGAFLITMHFLSLNIASPKWNLVEHPIWILSPLLFTIGIVMIFFRLLGEMITYYLISGRKSYKLFVARKSEKKEENIS